MEHTFPTQSQQLTYNHIAYHSLKERFTSHMHNAFELILYVHGDVSYIVENRRYDLQKYDLVITHPAELHFMQINSNTDYERYNLLIPLNHPLTRLLFKIPRNLDVLNCSNHTIIKENFKRMPFYEKIFPKDEFQDLLSALLTEILYNVLALDDNFNQQQNVVSPLIQKSLAYINEHLFTIKNIGEISNALFVAQNYFFRLFKETLNISPKKYITTKRLLHAQSLLRAGKKPTQIYEQIGFSNYVSFYQQYVALFGYSPSSERVIV